MTEPDKLHFCTESNQKLALHLLRWQFVTATLTLRLFGFLSMWTTLFFVGWLLVIITFIALSLELISPRWFIISSRSYAVLLCLFLANITLIGIVVGIFGLWLYLSVIGWLFIIIPLISPLLGITKSWFITILPPRLGAALIYGSLLLQSAGLTYYAAVLVAMQA
ncbi:MAG: hypothetical protein AB4290_20810 [Spirulina sp.]